MKNPKGLSLVKLSVMVKRIVLLPALLLLLVSCASSDKRFDLKVLYVGGTPEFEPITHKDVAEEEFKASVAVRMKSFEDFLNGYFTSVTVIHADNYTQNISEDYDVTVMDGVPKPIVPRYTDGRTSLPAGYLTEDFDRPMLTIGVVSYDIGRRIGTKNDWYCLCLEADAHGWREEHPIFHKPFAVEMTVVNKPTPESYNFFPNAFDGGVPDEMPMWRVQEKDSDMDSRIGLVAHPGGYEDSPECEVISSGVCSKSPKAVAIARHGNFFHWGFAASPANLTEEAKPVLANAIVYISKFAGQTPIARKYNDRVITRDHTEELKGFLSRGPYEIELKRGKAASESLLKKQEEAKKKKESGEQLSEEENYALTYKPRPPRPYEQYVKGIAGKLYESFGADIAAYEKYFDDNHDYFYWEDDGSYTLKIDEDVKSLGIANNNKRVLDAAIKLLETGKEVEKGKRILSRYTLEDFPTPTEWREWYEKYKDKLFFTESGGWVFLINSREPGLNNYKARELRAGVGASSVVAGETSNDDPVAVAAGVSVLQDGNRVLNIKLKVHPGYHVYDRVSQSDAFTAFAVNVTFPQGYSPVGELKRAPGSYYNEKGTTVYRDEAVFSQEFTGSGEGTITYKVEYQCCDPNICFMPQEKELTIAVK
jgi:hypothetical protein